MAGPLATRVPLRRQSQSSHHPPAPVADVQEPLETFLARVGALEEKLGPILYQLPPSMHRNEELLEGFLSLLPPGLQHVVEFSHQSWSRRACAGAPWGAGAFAGRRSPLSIPTVAGCGL